MQEYSSAENPSFTCSTGSIVRLYLFPLKPKEYADNRVRRMLKAIESPSGETPETIESASSKAPETIESPETIETIPCFATQAL